MQCKCSTTQHENHPGKPCDKSATTDESYCEECHDKAVKGAADTEPDMRAFQAR